MRCCKCLTGELSPVGSLVGKLSGAPQIKGVLSVPSVIGPPYYDGEYEFTPTQEAQTLEVGGYIMRQNVTINAIPSNYGLITWDGARLVVS